MKRDFTYDIYSKLIDSFKKAGYGTLPFIDIISNGHMPRKYVVMRHDVGKGQRSEVRSRRSGKGQMSLSFTKLHIHSDLGLFCLLLSRCFGLLPIVQ